LYPDNPVILSLKDEFNSSFSISPKEERLLPIVVLQLPNFARLNIQKRPNLPKITSK
jgi:hypothetical protein